MVGVKGWRNRLVTRISKLRHLNKNIALIYTFSFLRSMHFMSAVLFAFYTKWGGFEEETAITTITVLQLWFVVCVTFFETPTGFVADKYGRKYSLALGAVVCAIGWVIYTATPQIWCFAIGETVLALGVVLMSGADSALIEETCREEKLNTQKVFSKAGVLSMTGMLVAAPLGSLFAANFGTRFAMFSDFFPCVLAGLLILNIKEPKREKPKEGYKASFKQVVSIIRKRKIILMLALNMTIVANMGLVGIWLYQPLLTKLNVPFYYFGVVHAAMVTVELIIMAVFLPNLGKGGSLGKIGYINISSLLPALGFLIAAVCTKSLPAMGAAVIIVGFGMSRRPFFEKEINSLIGKVAENDEENSKDSTEKRKEEESLRATIGSTLGMMRSGGQIIANLFVIAFAANFLNQLLLACGLLLLVFIAWWNIYYKKLL